MRSMYDVQQLLKRYGIFVYVGNRSWDIEVMMSELRDLRLAKVIEEREFISAMMILKREYRIETQEG